MTTSTAEMNKNKKISVIVPVLNGATSITKALDSILCQVGGSIEINIIDGGSTDGTMAIVEEYRDRINYIETGSDNGIVDAFNRGVAKCGGDYIAILNSDDYWEPQAIRMLKGAFVDTPDADIYCGAIRYLDPHTGYTYTRRPNLSRMGRGMHIFHPAMFVRREAYEKVGLYKESFRYAMDSEWCHRAMAIGLKFEEIDEVLAVMSLGGTSDVHYKQSLWEYRNSLIQHSIAPAWKANYYYLRNLAIKKLMKNNFLHSLKRMKDGAVEKGIFS